MPIVRILTGIGAASAIAMFAAESYSAARPAGFDPLVLDPAVLSIAVSTPQQIRLRAGDVVVRFALIGPGGQSVVEESFALAPATVVVGPSRRPRLQNGEHLIVTRLSVTDHDRLNKTQETIRRVKEANGKATGQFEIVISGACRAGPLGPAPTYSTYLHTGHELISLARNVPFARAVAPLGASQIPVCDRPRHAKP